MGWFLFTARDPARSDFVVEACRSNGSQAPQIVQDNGDGLGPMMDRVFEQYPNELFYGWLADDTFPETFGWNLPLERAAGDWCLSYAADGGYQNVEDLVAGSYFSSGLCWGGDLVRAAGSWSLGFHSAYIDVAWAGITQPLHLHRYLADVRVRHDHWRMERRQRDGVDESSANRILEDQQKFADWQRDTLPGLVGTIEQRIFAPSRLSVKLCVS